MSFSSAPHPHDRLRTVEAPRFHWRGERPLHHLCLLKATSRPMLLIATLSVCSPLNGHPVPWLEGAFELEVSRFFCWIERRPLSVRHPVNDRD